MLLLEDGEPSVLVVVVIMVSDWLVDAVAISVVVDGMLRYDTRTSLVLDTVSLVTSDRAGTITSWLDVRTSRSGPANSKAVFASVLLYPKKAVWSLFCGSQGIKMLM
jgi:hypothetical protein